MGATGNATIDFGNAPGATTTSVVVSSAGVTVSSLIEAFMMADTTASHNDIEHILTPIRLICKAGTDSFTIYASTDLRLTGTFTVHWVWV